MRSVNLENQARQLSEACFQHNYERVQALCHNRQAAEIIKQMLNTHSPSHAQASAYVYALSQTTPQITRELLKRGAKPNAHRRGEPCALQLACTRKHDNDDSAYQIVSHLIDEGAHITGQTLFTAINHKHYRIADLLLGRASRNDVDNEASYPKALISAIQHRQYQLAEKIINKIKEHSPSPYEAYFIQQALCLLIDQRQIDLAKALITLPAWVSAINKANNRYTLEYQDHPVCHAIQNEQDKLAIQLLEKIPPLRKQMRRALLQAGRQGLQGILEALICSGRVDLDDIDRLTKKSRARHNPTLQKLIGELKQILEAHLYPTSEQLKTKFTAGELDGLSSWVSNFATCNYQKLIDFPKPKLTHTMTYAITLHSHLSQSCRNHGIWLSTLQEDGYHVSQGWRMAYKHIQKKLPEIETLLYREARNHHAPSRIRQHTAIPVTARPVGFGAGGNAGAGAGARAVPIIEGEALARGEESITSEVTRSHSTTRTTVINSHRSNSEERNNTNQTENKTAPTVPKHRSWLTGTFQRPTATRRPNPDLGETTFQEDPELPPPSNSAA